MEFRIADTLTDSLARLTGEEQKVFKTTAFDLQINPANPGLSFHKLDKAKDKNFWSVRVGSETSGSSLHNQFASSNISFARFVVMMSKSRQVRNGSSYLSLSSSSRKQSHGLKPSKIAKEARQEGSKTAHRISASATPGARRFSQYAKQLAAWAG